jgi:hypothetical protein
MATTFPEPSLPSSLLPSSDGAAVGLAAALDLMAAQKMPCTAGLVRLCSSSKSGQVLTSFAIPANCDEQSLSGSFSKESECSSAHEVEVCFFALNTMCGLLIRQFAFVAFNLQYGAKVSKQPYRALHGTDVLCTKITSTINGGMKYIVRTIEVSNGVNTKHANNGSFIFSTGGQTMKVVEIYVNCHPLYSATSCQPTKTLGLTNGGKSTMVTMLYKALKINNLMYIQAIDLDQIVGPVTAPTFVGGLPGNSK